MRVFYYIAKMVTWVGHLLAVNSADWWKPQVLYIGSLIEYQYLLKDGEELTARDTQSGVHKSTKGTVRKPDFSPVGWTFSKEFVKAFFAFQIDHVELPEALLN